VNKRANAPAYRRAQKGASRQQWGKISSLNAVGKGEKTACYESLPGNFLF
jgi:hypothetical protein